MVRAAQRVTRSVTRSTPKPGHCAPSSSSFSSSMDHGKEDKHDPTPPEQAKPKGKDRSTLPPPANSLQARETHPPPTGSESDPKDEGQRHVPGAASQKRKQKRRVGANRRQPVQEGNKNPKKKQKHVGPGTVAPQETRIYPKGDNTGEPKLPYFQLISEILQTNHPDIRIQSLAVQALEEAAEAYIIFVLEMANFCNLHVMK